MPTADECVIRNLVDRRAAERPDDVFAVFQDGTTWTHAELRGHVRRAARALQDIGVVQGDHVLVWLPNGPDCLKVWFAVNYLGAVYVPINLAYRGGILEHVVALSDAAIGIVHGDLVERLATVDRGRLKQLVVFRDKGIDLPGLIRHAADILDDAPAEVADAPTPIEPWTTQAIIFTSGTTGPSKGVLSSYAHLHASGQGFPLATAADRHLITLPLFHAGGTIPIHLMLSRGGSIALVDGFSTDGFWDTVARTGTTTLILLGVMAGFLMKRTEPAGNDTALRWVTALPLDEDAIGFGRRFGVTVMTTFNMTEVSCPLLSERNPTVVSSCGRPRPGVAARVVDENDNEVPPGMVGELIVRTDQPWAMNHGYYKNPEATARAWRNGWFHTGDGFRVDTAGNFFFVDRIKDAIRRRGENISSFEVETEVCAYPAIREAAAVAVASEIAEDEVLVAVSLAPGHTLDPVALIDFLRPRLAHFMIPRYIRVLDDLPKTPTQKVQKHVLRTAGVTADAWDREKAGVVVKRERLTP